MAKFKWLHISDLHIPSESHSYQQYKEFIDYILEGNQGFAIYDQLERGGMQGIIDAVGGIDCIIITGDCFHHGVFSNDAVKNVSSIISSIYDTCSKHSDWDWNNGMPMDRLCYCPGNHDLIRDERIRQEDNRHRFEYRKDAIIDLSERGDAHLQIKNENSPRGKLVIEKPFQFFNSTMMDLTNANELKEQGRVEYLEGNQITCFYPPCEDGWNDYKIVVVGLNTALLAGQVVKCRAGTEFQTFVSQQEATIDKAIHDMDLTAASSAWLELINECRSKSGELTADEGRLCLPQQRVWDKLSEKLSDTRIIPILFGHHSSACLNSDARSSFNKLLRRCNIPVYLCGHAHQIHDNRIGETAFARFSRPPCLEVVGGGLFWDNTSYNQISFSIGTIELQEDDSRNARLSTTIEHYACVQDRGGNRAGTKDAGVWTKGIVKSESTLQQQQVAQYGGMDEFQTRNEEKMPEETKDETENLPKENINRSEDNYWEGLDEEVRSRRSTINVKNSERLDISLPLDFFK